MKFILMMHGTQADFEWYARWSRPDMVAHAGFMRQFSSQIRS